MKTSKNGFELVQTVEENKTNFTKKEKAAANNAKKLYHNIGRPGYKTFCDGLNRGLIQNCTVSMSDAKNAVKIYGLDEGVLKDKSERKKQQQSQHIKAISSITIIC